MPWASASAGNAAPPPRPASSGCIRERLAGRSHRRRGRGLGPLSRDRWAKACGDYTDERTPPMTDPETKDPLAPPGVPPHRPGEAAPTADWRSRELDLPSVKRLLTEDARSLARPVRWNARRCEGV